MKLRHAPASSSPKQGFGIASDSRLNESDESEVEGEDQGTFRRLYGELLAVLRERFPLSKPEDTDFRLFGLAFGYILVAAALVVGYVTYLLLWNTGW